MARILYLLFAAISVVGAFAIVSRLRSRGLALAVAFALAVFFAALLLLIEAMMREAGL